MLDVLHRRRNIILYYTNKRFVVQGNQLARILCIHTNGCLRKKNLTDKKLQKKNKNSNFGFKLCDQK